MAKDIQQQMADKKFANDRKLAAQMAKKIAAEKKQDEADRKASKGW